MKSCNRIWIFNFCSMNSFIVFWNNSRKKITLWNNSRKKKNSLNNIQNLLLLIDFISKKLWVYCHPGKRTHSFWMSRLDSVLKMVWLDLSNWRANGGCWGEQQWTRLSARWGSGGSSSILHSMCKRICSSRKRHMEVAIDWTTPTTPDIHHTRRPPHQKSTTYCV